jgi:hypothetical protein
MKISRKFLIWKGDMGADGHPRGRHIIQGA